MKDFISTDGLPITERVVQPKKESTRANGYDTSLQAGVNLEDFVAVMPQRDAFIFKPAREIWPGSSVNARCPPVTLVDEDGKPLLNKDGTPIKVAASKWLSTYRPIEQMTWCPGLSMEIKDKLVSAGGWIDRPGCTTFNLYPPPTIMPRPGDVQPWLDHISKVYPNDAVHIINWLAHRVQRPHEKINHALVLGGLQGIGKDSILEPVKDAIGRWNFEEVGPQTLLRRFNGFLKSVILRVNEARDLGDVDRFAFYDHLKAYTAAPPDVLRVDEKNIREYAVFNVCGVILTTNHKTNGLYLPADDRRHYVAWSDLDKEDFAADYWDKLHGWYASGGNERVAFYLRSLDLSDFKPKAPPPKTAAFWEIVDASRAPEDAELADALDAIAREGEPRPDIVTVDKVVAAASADFALWLRDRKNARRIPHRFEACGYVAVRNPNDTEGRWKINGVRHTIYGKAALPPSKRLDAALKYAGAR